MNKKVIIHSVKKIFTQSDKAPESFGIFVPVAPKWIPISGQGLVTIDGEARCLVTAVQVVVLLCTTLSFEEIRMAGWLAIPLQTE